MLRAGALMIALLVLAPFTERSERGHLLLCEVWPGHLKEYQQLLIASDNDSYKTSLNRILEQSTLKKDSRNYKSFRMNVKIHGKSAIKNHQLRYAVQFKINLNLVGVKKTLQILKKQFVTFSNVLMQRNYLRRLSMLMNTNLKDCKVKVNLYITVRKKFEGNKSHASYFENGCKYMETRLPMSYMAHQANILRSEELLQKSLKSLGSIILNFTKQHKGEDHIETSILKEKCKNSIDRLLASVKEFFFNVITNEYNKNLHRIVSNEQKILNRERKIYIGFKSLEQEKNIKEKIKMWKWKISKKSIYANQKLQFRHLFTYQRNSHIQKVYSTHKKMFNIQRKKIPVFQTKNYRMKHLIQKWGNIVGARQESKFGENEMGILFKNCHMHFSIINLKFLTITICMKQEFFSSRKYQTRQLIQMKKMLRYLLPSSERVKNKYFSLSQKGLEMSFLKTPIVKWLIKKEGFPGLTYRYFYKNIFNSPSSTVERTKRSEKDKTESISVGALRHLSNALVAGATIFGIALLIIALAGFYLYLKRRQVLKFFNTVLKDGKSSRKTKSTDAQDYAPISVSQNFHFVQPKDSRKKQTAADIDAKDHVAVKKIYDSSDTEEGSKRSHRSLTVRSRAYVFPSRSSGSVQSFYDDVCDICSAQFSLSDEFIIEKPCSNLSSTTPKAKETVSVACQTNHYLKDDQNYYINTDMSPQLKKPTISRSKSENDIVKASSSNTSRPVQSLTRVSEVQNP